jgi:nucleoside-diphosphate-sugar epimerase
MADVLLTGGTGLVGSSVARELVRKGRGVRALVRSLERGRESLPSACELFQGDVTDIESVRAAMEGCSSVYHVAALPEQWLPDPSAFERVNVGGTRNMIEAALGRRVEKFIYTSTIDVFAAPPGGQYDESTLDPNPKGTHYQRSKQEADRAVAAALERGLPAVFLHPSGVYGPAPARSPMINDAIVRLVRGKTPLLPPGGMPVVLCDDVASGHLLAEERAPVGGRYILSESYLSLAEFARAVCEEAGTGSRVPSVMPAWLASAVAALGEAVAAITRRPPLVPRGQLHFLLLQARPVARKAREELGWQPTPFREGLRRTLAYLLPRGLTSSI